MFFCTDGLTDARNVYEEEFGVERIQEECLRHSGESTLDLLGHVFSAITILRAECVAYSELSNGQQLARFQLTLPDSSRKNGEYLLAMRSPR